MSAQLATFLADRDIAENAYDNRLIESEAHCPRCCRGWLQNELGDFDLRCGACQGGTIYFLKCRRCDQPESDCECSVNDFMFEVNQ